MVEAWAIKMLLYGLLCVALFVLAVVRAERRGR